MNDIFWGRSNFVRDYDQLRFNEFLNLEKEDLKSLCRDENGRLKHIVRVEHFDQSFIDEIYLLAKTLKKCFRGHPRWINGLLSEFSVLNYFQQPSSRTFLSFSSAESLLGMRREEVRDISTSSTMKGESDKDALRTISSYFDAIVCRHESDIYDLFAVWVMHNSDREIPIINAGSGKSEHPTQALLDFFTIKESFQKPIEELHIGFVGDCLRGRTVHSLAKLLSNFAGVKLSFIAPKDLQLDQATTDYLISNNVEINFENESLKNILPNLDVVYMTRVQDEHGGSGIYSNEFKFTMELLDIMKEDGILMHPMPKREEIDPKLDFLKRDPRIMYWRQQRNGMWVRAALLAYLFDKSDTILNLQ